MALCFVSWWIVWHAGRIVSLPASTWKESLNRKKVCTALTVASLHIFTCKLKTYSWLATQHFYEFDLGGRGGCLPQLTNTSCPRWHKAALSTSAMSLKHAKAINDDFFFQFGLCAIPGKNKAVRVNQHSLSSAPGVVTHIYESSGLTRGGRRHSGRQQARRRFYYTQWGLIYVLFFLVVIEGKISALWSRRPSACFGC